MISFSLNRQVDLSEVDLVPREGQQHWLGREWLGEVYLQCASGQKGSKPVIPNLDAYAYACEEHTRLKNYKEYVPIVSEDEVEQGFKGIMLEQLEQFSDHTVQQTCSIDFSFEEEDEYRAIFNDFVDMRELIFLDKSIDFVDLLLQAERCVPTAVKVLQDLHKEYARLEDLTRGILKGKHWKEDLIRLTHEPIVFDGE